MTENDLVELYYIIDDFYQRFIKTETGKKNLAEYYGKRGPKRSMTVPEVMTLNIIRILDRTGDLKTFHKTACLHYRAERGLSYYDSAMVMAQKDSKFAGLTEELKVKKEIESAKYLIQTGDFNSAKRLIERLNKRAGKTLQGYQKTIARLLAEC